MGIKSARYSHGRAVLYFETFYQRAINRQITHEPGVVSGGACQNYLGSIPLTRFGLVVGVEWRLSEAFHSPRHYGLLREISLKS